MLALLFSGVFATVYLEERFDSGWETRWKRPDVVRKGVQLGKVRVSAGSFFGNEKIQRGLETLEGRRHYLLYSNFSQVFDTRGRDLILQYTVRLSMAIDCAGQYVKLFTTDVHPTQFSNESQYAVMFGPDICGAVRRKTHVILGYNGSVFNDMKGLGCYKDHLTHAYTLIIRANRTMEVRVDGELVDRAKLEDRFAIPYVTEVPDPKDAKPADWDDNPYIVDPNDVKPADWVDVEFIPDPDAFRPPSWDESIPWSPPMIRDPRYKGPWTPRTIPNPNYKGVWRPKTVKVSERMDPTFGTFPNLAFIGLEFYQSSSGSIFDNFLVTDDEEYANKMLKEVFLDVRDAELRSYERVTNRIVTEKEIEKDRDQKIRKMKQRQHLSDDVSESEKQKETKEERQERKRQQKKKLAEKRAAKKKMSNVDDFDSL